MRRPRVKDCTPPEPAPSGLILPGANGKLRRTAPSPRLAEPRGGQGVDAPDFAALPGGEEVLWITSDHDRNCQQSRGDAGRMRRKPPAPASPLGGPKDGSRPVARPRSDARRADEGFPIGSLGASRNPSSPALRATFSQRGEAGASGRATSPFSPQAGRRCRQADEGQVSVQQFGACHKPIHGVILGLVPRIWCPRHNPLTSHPY
jgi:hypothetical protein